MAFGGVHPFMLKKAAGGDVVTKSLRFNISDSAYLSRTQVSGSRTTWTFSAWVKRGDLTSSANQYFLSTNGGSDNTFIGFYFGTDDTFSVTGWSNVFLRTTQLFRDPSSWYHVVVQANTTSGTAAERLRVWLNGSEITSWTSDYRSSMSSMSLGIGNTTTQTIGWETTGSNDEFGGYLADVYLIDGTALTPTSFAEEDTTTGQWKPIAHSGSYGTNGFHLDFKDSSDIGNDVSGNNNDSTATNLASTDIMEDNPSAGMNYCVYNAVFAGATGLSEGNLKCTTTARGTFDAMSFASYWEIEANTTSVVGGVISETGTANTVAVTNGSTFGFRLSAAGALDYTSNGSSWTSIATGLSGEQFPYVTGGTTTANFGQSTLSYSVPSGYEVLSTAGMTATIAKGVTYFDTKIYDDGAGAKTFDNGTVSMQPDLVWVKSRGSAYDHKLTDSVRGVTKALESNTIDTEATDSTGLTAFGSDGFTVGADTNYSDTTGVGMVAWAWKKSATAGFNIVGWTGDDDGFSGGTQAVAHGLGVAPEMVIAKNRTDEAGGNGNWIVYHKDTSSGDLLKLNSTDGEFTPNDTLIGSIDSTNVSFGNDSIDSEYLNSNNDFGSGTPDTYIGYFFASVAGYSKVGSYTGNGSVDGIFIALGFSPAFFILKKVGDVGGWWVYDNKRDGYNVIPYLMMADSSGAESSSSAYDLDLVSNGVKLRNGMSAANGDGGTYIFYAVAEKPLKYANAR